MKAKIKKQSLMTPGAFMAYKIDGMAKPLANLFVLDNGYLAVWLKELFGDGYDFKAYKTRRDAEKAADKEVLRTVKKHYDEAELVFVI